jgi:hypothetical protein
MQMDFSADRLATSETPGFQVSIGPKPTENFGISPAPLDWRVHRLHNRQSRRGNIGLYRLKNGLQLRFG